MGTSILQPFENLFIIVAIHFASSAVTFTPPGPHSLQCRDASSTTGALVLAMHAERNN